MSTWTETKARVPALHVRSSAEDGVSPETLAARAWKRTRSPEAGIGSWLHATHISARWR
jgi:hypothetical protein